MLLLGLPRATSWAPPTHLLGPPSSHCFQSRVSDLLQESANLSEPPVCETGRDRFQAGTSSNLTSAQGLKTCGLGSAGVFVSKSSARVRGWVLHRTGQR